jgi:hypothetical protein
LKIHLYIDFLFCLDQQGGQGQDGGDGSQTNEGRNNQQGGEGNENQPDGSKNPDTYYPDLEGGAGGNSTETGVPAKKGMSWIPIIIIAASIVALLLIGLLVLFLRKKKRTSGGKGYNQAPTSEQPAARS